MRAGKLARRKGANFERATMAPLRLIWPRRKLYRGKQGSEGGHAPGEGCDVEGSPFYIECKHEAQFNWRSAFHQALEKAAERGDGRPILIVGRDDKKPKGWVVGQPGTPDMAVLRYADFCRLLEEVEQLKRRVLAAESEAAAYANG